MRKRVGGSGLWHQVPAFWTAPTPAKKLTAKQLAERAQGETAIESAETQGGTASETTGAPTGAEAPLGTMPGFAAAAYPGYDVPADAVVVRVRCTRPRALADHGCTGRCIVRPGENTRKMFDEMDKARHADLWRVLVGVVDSPARSAHRTPDRLGDGLAGSHRKRARLNDPTAIDGVGPEIAESVVNWFAATREPGDWRGATLRAWQAAGVGVDERRDQLVAADAGRQNRGGDRFIGGLSRVIPPKRRLSSAAARRPVR